MTERQWFDNYARHMVDTELYAHTRSELTVSMLEKLHKELKKIVESYGSIRNKKQEKECYDECNECIEKYLSNWKEKEDEERNNYANSEMDWLANAILAALGVSLVNSLLKTTRSLETPFSNTDTFDSFVSDIKTDIQKAVRTPLLSSRIFGSSTSSVSESLDSAFKRIESNAKANMQSSVTGLQRNVQYQLIGDNRKLKFVYVSMLDDSTCVVCGGYSGTVYEDISEAPAVPVHIRCRCYYMPILTSSDDISDITGETYEEWFERQPDSVQYKILGPTRYGVYKSGVTSIKSFSSVGKKLTLEELFENLKNKTSKRALYLDKSGGKVLASYSKQVKEEKENLVAAIELAKRGEIVTLIKAVNKEGIRTADAIINGVYWEIKTNKKPTKSAIDHALRKANTQAKKMILNITSEITELDLIRGIKGRFPRTNLEEIIIIKDGVIRHYFKSDFV